MKKIYTYTLYCMLAACTSLPSAVAKKVPTPKRSSYTKPMTVGITILLIAAGTYGGYQWYKSKAQGGGGGTAYQSMDDEKEDVEEPQ